MATKLTVLEVSIDTITRHVDTPLLLRIGRWRITWESFQHLAESEYFQVIKQFYLGWDVNLPFGAWDS
jgi:hypothetical protein